MQCSLKDISPVAISSFVNSRDLGDSAKRGVIIVFRSLYAFARRCGYVGISPAHLLRCPRPNETITERILSDENLRQMLKYATTERDHMIVSFFYNSGARVQEVAKVKAKDLTHRSDGSILVKIHGKGGRNRRVVLNLSFSKRLRAFAQDLPENASLVYGQRGALTHSGLRKVIKRIVRRAKLNPRISPHWLRHFFANTALNNGARLHHVSHALGHKSLRTTSVYTHGTLSTGEAPSSFLAKTKEIVEDTALLPM
jgi:integrase/recombinase XerD